MKYHKFKKIEAAAERHKLAGFKLTAKQLANITGKDGITGLHLAAHHGCLDQIVGGATTRQLEDCLTDHRCSAFYLAVAAGHLPQIKGGVTASHLADTKQVADFAIGSVMGTAEELAEMSDEEYLDRMNESAQTNHTRNLPQSTGLHWAAAYGQLDQVVGGVTVEHLNGLRDKEGFSALDVAAVHGHLDQIFGGVTAAQLASSSNPDGKTPLHLAAGYGHLDQILGGATYEQLSSVRETDGCTPLHYAAYYRALDQIKDGVTAEQLASVRKENEFSALHAATAYIQIRGGVTAEQLINTVASNGSSALLGATACACLNQITGGVTAEQLSTVTDPDGTAETGLHLAARFGALDQIKGGASITQLVSAKDKNGRTALDEALETRQLLELMIADPRAYWQALQPEEQEILRKILAEHPLPEKIVEAIGCGIPTPYVDFNPDGTVTYLNFIADNQVYDTLPVTRSLKQLEMEFPALATLTCHHCQKSSRISIPERISRRHPCPQCGTIHYFNPEIYELEALHRIKSLRQIFPWHVKGDCECGTHFEQRITDRKQGMTCPNCAAKFEFQYPEREKALLDMIKHLYAYGKAPGGWSATPENERAQFQIPGRTEAPPRLQVQPASQIVEHAHVAT